MRLIDVIARLGEHDDEHTIYSDPPERATPRSEAMVLPAPEEARRAVLHYATHDAYEPVEGD